MKSSPTGHGLLAMCLEWIHGKKYSAVYTVHLESLAGTVLAEIERRLMAVSECDDADSDGPSLDVETVHELRDEVQHVREVLLVDAAGRVQHEHDVRLVHARCRSTPS